jgi:hypothetical protein
MGKTRGPYNAEYPKGAKVRVADLNVLEDFKRNWNLHNKLEPNQLEFAGVRAEVESVGFYHGGDELYKLKNVPGIWHEQCLEPEAAER